VRRTGAIAVAIATAGVMLLSGCSTTIDVGTLESSVQTGLAEQLGGEWTVQCPDSMEVQAGLTTNCMATSAAGETLEVNVTQTDDQGNVTWEVPQTGLDIDKLETGVAAEIAAQVGGEWTVTCPDDIPMEKDLTANCEATSADGQSTMINVTQTDDQGNVTWETTE
jgi:ornithine carbamoyltransferase